jgi:thiol-disulfide isomerase/thioredoxin
MTRKTNDMNSSVPSQRRKRFWTPARVTLSFIALALLAAVGASSCNQSAEVTTNGNGSQPGQTPAQVAVTRTAPAEGTSTNSTTPSILPAVLREAPLAGLDGRAFKLSDYAGKVILINLWASWCGPCRQEMPHLVELNKEYKARGLQLVGLTTEDPATAGQRVKDFVRDQKVDYQIGYAKGDFAVALMQGHDVIPQSFLISRDGHMLKHFIGFNPAQTPAQLREAIDQALNEKSGT